MIELLKWDQLPFDVVAQRSIFRIVNSIHIHPIREKGEGRIRIEEKEKEKKDEKEKKEKKMEAGKAIWNKKAKEKKKE